MYGKMTMSLSLRLLEQAFQYRMPLFLQLQKENTDCYRLFHGITEGMPGLTIDRYGTVVLVQTFGDPLQKEAIQELEANLYSTIKEYLPDWKPVYFVYNHRGQDRHKGWDYWHIPVSEALEPQIIHENGLKFISYARHRGQDPLLFLDLRAARRYVRDHCNGQDVLNLFAYTCGVGIHALAGKASSVWNIDFALSALEYGQRNHQENGSLPGFHIIQEDVFCALYQLAGQPLKGKRARLKPRTILQPHQFDLVFLDPPAWATSPYGAVDLVRDYQSLFKPCLWVTKPGGKIIAVNNVAHVMLEDWLEKLNRCAIKANHPLKNITLLQPDLDFPTWDQKPPLKIAVCEVL